MHVVTSGVGADVGHAQRRLLLLLVFPATVAVAQVRGDISPLSARPVLHRVWARSPCVRVSVLMRVRQVTCACRCMSHDSLQQDYTSPLLMNNPSNARPLYTPTSPTTKQEAPDATKNLTTGFFPDNTLAKGA